MKIPKYPQLFLVFFLKLINVKLRKNLELYKIFSDIKVISSNFNVYLILNPNGEVN
jgi:hypothetical protein